RAGKNGGEIFESGLMRSARRDLHPTIVLGFGREYKFMIAVIALDRKHPKFDARIAHALKFVEQMLAVEAQPPHHRLPLANAQEVTIHCRLQVTQALREGNNWWKKDGNLRVWQIVKWQVNHQRSARFQNAVNVTKDRERTVVRFKMLKHMHGKYCIACSISDRESSAIRKSERYVRFWDVFARIVQLMLRNIQSCNVLETLTKLLSDSSSSTTNLNASSEIQAIMLPMRLKVCPINAAKLIKFLVSPSILTASFLTLPCGDRIKRITFPPLLP